MIKQLEVAFWLLVAMLYGAAAGYIFAKGIHFVWLPVVGVVMGIGFGLRLKVAE